MMISKTYIMIHNTEAILQTTLGSVVILVVIAQLIVSKVKGN